MNVSYPDSTNKEAYRLIDALGIRSGDVVSLVGGGGKTTLMFALAQELISSDGLVITTTTTKISRPDATDNLDLCIIPDEEEAFDFIVKKQNQHRHIILVSKALDGDGKLKGLKPELISRLIRLEAVRYIIVEADGANHRPLKAPDIQFEPVIPHATSLVVPVVGFDALDMNFSEEHVFRSKIAEKITGYRLGEIITPDFISKLITDVRGMTYGTPQMSRIVPFINKLDAETSLIKGRELAHSILLKAHPQIDRVVLGRAKFQPPVWEVIYNPK